MSFTPAASLAPLRTALQAAPEQSHRRGQVENAAGEALLEIFVEPGLETLLALRGRDLLRRGRQPQVRSAAFFADLGVPSAGNLA